MRSTSRKCRPTGPITPLGFLKQRFYFLDFAGQLIELGSEFRKGELMALYGTRMGCSTSAGRSGKRSRDQARRAARVRARRLFAEGRAAGAYPGLLEAAAVRPQAQGARARRAPRRPRRAGAPLRQCGDRRRAQGRARPSAASASARFKSGEVGGYIYPTLEAITEPAEEPAPVDSRRHHPRLPRNVELAGQARSRRICCCAGSPRRCSAARCASARMAGSSARRARARPRCRTSCAS
jgi:hypothetical protein